MDRRTTYSCNSCNTDLSPNTSTLICLNCNSRLPSNPNPSHQNPSSVTASDENFLLDRPYLHRLIHHLTNSTDTSSSPSTINTISRYHSPTLKSAIDAIPRVTITQAFLEIDPIVLCAVCKDQFVINDETNQLPCKHMYHPDCILPWLSNHNSCPVCRFEMPKEPVNRNQSRSRVFRFRDLIEDVDDEVMLGIGFGNLENQYTESEIDPETVSYIGQTVEVDVLPDSDPTRSSENVSGWRRLPVNARAADGVNAGWGGNADVSNLRNWPVNGVDVGDGQNVYRRRLPVNARAVDGVNAGWGGNADVSGWRNWPVNGVDVGDGQNVYRRRLPVNARAVNGVNASWGDNADVSGWRSWPVNAQAVDGVNAGWQDNADVAMP